MFRLTGLSFSVLIFLSFSSASWAADQHPAKGVVNNVKISAGKLTISHGPIVGLGMEAMTMDFKVYDPAMLDEVNKGHEIAFVLEQTKKDGLMIMEIEDLGLAKSAPAEDSHEHSHQH